MPLTDNVGIKRKKKMRYLSFVFLIYLFSNTVFADSNSPEITIKKIDTGWSNEGIYIHPNEDVPLQEGCTRKWYRVDADNEWMDKILSMSLSAFHGNSKVVFRLSGCTNFGKVMRVIAVTLVK